MKYFTFNIQLYLTRFCILLLLPVLLNVMGCQSIMAALGEGPRDEATATPTWPLPVTATPSIVPPTMPAPVMTNTPQPTATPVLVYVSAPTPIVTPTPEVGYYGDSTLGFGFFYPSTWSAEKINGGIRVENDSPRVFLLGLSNLIDEGATPDDFIIELYNVIGEADTVERLSDTVLNLWDGSQARVIEFAEAGSSRKARVTLLNRGRRVFVVLLVASLETFDSHPETLQAIAASMHVEEPRPHGISRQNALFLSSGQPRTLDPAQTGGSAGGTIGAIFSGLVMLDESLQVGPDLAERWEISDDGLVYTFYLRPDATFHNGKPVTAHDVKFSWERAADPATESNTVTTYMGDIVGVKAKFEGEADEIAGVEVVDDYTLKVTIDAPKVYFLAKLTYPTSFVVDEQNVQAEDWEHHPNGTGPFRLLTWEDDALIILGRYDNFYQEPAKLEHVILMMYADVPMWMYENDEIDMTGVGTNNIERVTDPANPLSADLHITPGLCTTRYMFDVTMPPFDDPLVRQAFSYAIDRQKLAEVVLKGMSQPAYTILPPGMPGYSQDIKAPTFDPDLALELLTASTYGSADNLPEITFTTSGLGGGLSRYLSAILEMWRTHLGVEVTVEQLEPISFNTEVRKHHGQIVSRGWCADYPDPENFLDVLYHSDTQENFGNYSNPEVDKLLERARVEADIETRLALYHQIEQMIIDDAPDILLSQGQGRSLLKPYLKNYPSSPIGLALKWRLPSIERATETQE